MVYHIEASRTLALLCKASVENPDGDTKKLIADLQTLKNLQNVDNQGGKVKPIFQRTACPKCNIKGHLEKDCWGQCKICKGWGHKAKHCRQRPELVEEAKAIISKMGTSPSILFLNDLLCCIWRRLCVEKWV